MEIVCGAELNFTISTANEFERILKGMPKGMPLGRYGLEGNIFIYFTPSTANKHTFKVRSNEFQNLCLFENGDSLATKLHPQYLICL